MEWNKISYQTEHHIGWITMHCVENLNAIDEGMAEELLRILALCEEDPQVRVIVLRSGAKAFSSGGDMKYFHQKMKENDAIELNTLAASVGNLALKLRSGTKMVIAEVNGVAAGAGANLALNCDFILCGESASFIQAFVLLGLVPDTGGGYLLPKTIGLHRAIEYCALGKAMPAEQAHAMGLVYQVVPDEELHSAVNELAVRLANGPCTAYANLKKQLLESCFPDYARYLTQVEANTINDCAATSDFREGVHAFIEKRAPHFQE